MSSRLPSACAEPGCPAVTTQRRCPKHHREYQRAYAAQPDRKEAQQQYQTKGWREIRAAVLERDPICRGCRQVATTDAAHIISRADGGADTMANLRGLCHRCHSAETVKRDGAFGNPVRRSGLVVAHRRLAMPRR